MSWNPAADYAAVGQERNRELGGRPGCRAWIENANPPVPDARQGKRAADGSVRPTRASALPALHTYLCSGLSSG